jgi:LPS-assembly lipoprotein
MIRLFSLLACLVLLTSCGFSPMYASSSFGGGSEISDQLAQVQIENIPDREGQLLRNELIDRFYRDGRPSNPRYSLKVMPIEEYKRELDVTIGSDTTRAQLRMQTDMILTDLETGDVVLKDGLTTYASYNVLGDQYATSVSEDNTRDNSIRDLARQIEQKTALYLNSK